MYISKISWCSQVTRAKYSHWLHTLLPCLICYTVTRSVQLSAGHHCTASVHNSWLSILGEMNSLYIIGSKIKSWQKCIIILLMFIALLKSLRVILTKLKVRFTKLKVNIYGCVLLLLLLFDSLFNMWVSESFGIDICSSGIWAPWFTCSLNRT